MIQEGGEEKTAPHCPWVSEHPCQGHRAVALMGWHGRTVCAIPAAGRLCADKALVGDAGLWLLSSDRFLIKFCGSVGESGSHIHGDCGFCLVMIQFWKIV